MGFFLRRPHSLPQFVRKRKISKCLVYFESFGKPKDKTCQRTKLKSSFFEVETYFISKLQVEFLQLISLSNFSFSCLYYNILSSASFFAPEIRLPEYPKNAEGFDLQQHSGLPPEQSIGNSSKKVIHINFAPQATTTKDFFMIQRWTTVA